MTGHQEQGEDSSSRTPLRLQPAAGLDALGTASPSEIKVASSQKSHMTEGERNRLEMASGAPGPSWLSLPLSSLMTNAALS